MRILHISNNYTPYAGGIVSSLNVMLPTLQMLGHEIMLVVPDFTKKALTDFDFVHRVPSAIRFSYRNNLYAIPWRSRAYIEQKIRSFEPDVIHLHHPFLLGYTASQLAQKYTIPSLFTYHTMYDKYAHYIPLPSSFVAPHITKTVLNFCNYMVDAIVAPSKGIGQWLTDRAVQAPIHIVPSAISDHFFQNHEKDFNHPQLQLLYVGRLTPEKNVGTIIDVYASLNPSLFHLTIVGFGCEEQMLRHQAYTLHGLSQESITFIIKPSLEILLQAYRNADLFLFSSVTDTQGIVLAEALAAGLPVVALDGYGQRDTVISGYNGFLVTSPAQMRDAIMLLYEQREILHQLSQHSRTMAENFERKKIARQLIQLYETIQK